MFAASTMEAMGARIALRKHAGQNPGGIYAFRASFGSAHASSRRFWFLDKRICIAPALVFRQLEFGQFFFGARDVGFTRNAEFKELLLTT
jgi:hypothetical protein